MEEMHIFEPSERKQIALKATDSYFNNLPEELKMKLMADPIEYTMMYAEVYAKTVNRIQNDEKFQVKYNKR